jgi:hypothetical protein
MKVLSKNVREMSYLFLSTVEELTTNVKKLVEHALTLTPSSSDNPDEEDIPILVGRNIKMYFEGSDGAVKTSWIGHVISTGSVPI